MTGRTTLEDIKDVKIREFVKTGVNPDIKNRYKNIEDLRMAFRDTFI